MTLAELQTRIRAIDDRCYADVDKSKCGGANICLLYCIHRSRLTELLTVTGIDISKEVLFETYEMLQKCIHITSSCYAPSYNHLFSCGELRMNELTFLIEENKKILYQLITLYK
jgi:hypothetical protein